MEIEVKETINNDNKQTIDIPEFEGYITPAKEKYKRKTFVKPIAYHLTSKTGSPWTKHVCPVCQILGNENIVYKFDKTCPLCNVNFIWEDENKITYGDKKEYRKRTNNWHVTGYVGNSSYNGDLFYVDYILTVDYFITKNELKAALYEKYDNYFIIELEIEIVN